MSDAPLFTVFTLSYNRAHTIRRASKNSQISPSTIVRAAQGDSSRPNLTSVLRDGRENANVHANLGVILGIPVRII